MKAIRFNASIPRYLVTVVGVPGRAKGVDWSSIFVKELDVRFEIK